MENLIAGFVQFSTANAKPFCKLLSLSKIS